MDVEALVGRHRPPDHVSQEGKTYVSLRFRVLTLAQGSGPNSDVAKALADNKAVAQLMPALLDRLAGLKSAAKRVREEDLATVRAVGVHVVHHLSPLADQGTAADV
jgi:hypothetical protein